MGKFTVSTALLFLSFGFALAQTLGLEGRSDLIEPPPSSPPPTVSYPADNAQSQSTSVILDGLYIPGADAETAGRLNQLARDADILVHYIIYGVGAEVDKARELAFRIDEQVAKLVRHPKISAIAVNVISLMVHNLSAAPKELARYAKKQKGGFDVAAVSGPLLENFIEEAELVSGILAKLEKILSNEKLSDDSLSVLNRKLEEIYQQLSSVTAQIYPSFYLNQLKILDQYLTDKTELSEVEAVPVPLVSPPPDEIKPLVFIQEAPSQPTPPRMKLKELIKDLRERWGERQITRRSALSGVKISGEINALLNFFSQMRESLGFGKRY